MLGVKVRSVLFFLLFSACISVNDGGKPPDSNLEYLNGEKYHAEGPIVTVGPVPVIATFNRIDPQTEIRGQAKFIEGNSSNVEMMKKSFRYVRFANVYLKIHEDVKAKAITDEKGNFIISGFIPNGSYSLVVESKFYKGIKEIEVTGHELNGIEIPVSKRGDS